MPAQNNDALIDQIISLHEQQAILINKLKTKEKEIKPDFKKYLDRRRERRVQKK